MRSKYVYEAEVRYSNRVKVDYKIINSSENACTFLRDIWQKDMDRLERGYVIFLNKNHSILNYALHSKGGIDHTTFDLRIIFQEALIHGACNIIISHNHPSGSLVLSDQDVRITNDIRDVGKIMNINLLDHIVITEDAYFSFDDNGRI